MVGVLDGFTAAAAIIIGVGSFLVLLGFNSWFRAIPGAFVVVVLITKTSAGQSLGCGVAFAGSDSWSRWPWPRFMGAKLIAGIGLGYTIAVVVPYKQSPGGSPHTAVLDRLPGTTTHRNLAHFPEAETSDGLHAIRIDTELSFVKKLLLADVAEVRSHDPGSLRLALVLDCSGINDLDITSVAMQSEVFTASGVDDATSV